MCVLVCWNASLYAAALDNEFLDQFQLGISTNPHYLPVVYSCLLPFDCVWTTSVETTSDHAPFWFCVKLKKKRKKCFACSIDPSDSEVVSSGNQWWIYLWYWCFNVDEVQYAACCSCWPCLCILRQRWMNHLLTRLYLSRFLLKNRLARVLMLMMFADLSRTGDSLNISNTPLRSNAVSSFCRRLIFPISRLNSIDFSQTVSCLVHQLKE